jgi:hypothetical protein
MFLEVTKEVSDKKHMCCSPGHLNRISRQLGDTSWSIDSSVGYKDFRISKIIGCMSCNSIFIYLRDNVFLTSTVIFFCGAIDDL